MITAILPSQAQGKPYQECINLTGTQPFTLLSHNLASGEAKIVGSTLCLSIPSPSGAIDFAASVKGGCSGCTPETIVSAIGYVESLDECLCDPVTIPNQTIPPLVAGQYFAAIQLSGSMPFTLCGGAAPRCLSIELSGNMVIVKGRYDGNGDVKFSVKNNCSCDCVDFVIPKA